MSMKMYDKDQIGANVPHDLPGPVEGADKGPLKGLDFMVKDLFAVAGHKTGNGSPDFLAQTKAATQTAPLVQKLLDNGACLTGMTICDEFFYSLTGINAHYGSPVNVRARDRMAGGSSSGSAASVAASLCDFSIGSDTGGSVRVPAAFCGLYGIRPTHGEIDLTGATEMAPSFDTAGWFARDAELLKIIGDVLLPDQACDISDCIFHLATDTFAQATDDVQQSLHSVCDKINTLMPFGNQIEINKGVYLEWREAFRIIQAYEVKSTTLKWVKAHQPALGPGIKERFEMAEQITDTEYKHAQNIRKSVCERLDEIMEDGCVLVIPTAPVIAPLVATPAAELETFRQNTMALTCISGLTGLPQVTMPVAEVSNCPIGLSMIGKKHSDKMLLRLSYELSKHLN
jgi:amidase